MRRLSRSICISKEIHCIHAPLAYKQHALPKSLLMAVERQISANQYLWRMSNKGASPGLALRGRLLCTAGPDRWAPHVLYRGLASFVTGQPATPFSRSEPNFLLNARRLGREGFPHRPGQRVSVNGPHSLSWRHGIAERKPGRGERLAPNLGEKRYGI